MWCSPASSYWRTESWGKDTNCCVCKSAVPWTRGFMPTHTHTFMYTCTYTCIYLCGRLTCWFIDLITFQIFHSFRLNGSSWLLFCPFFAPAAWLPAGHCLSNTSRALSPSVSSQPWPLHSLWPCWLGRNMPQVLLCPFGQQAPHTSASSAQYPTSLDPSAPHRVVSHNPPDTDTASSWMHFTLPVCTPELWLLLCCHSPAGFHLQLGEVFNLPIYFFLLPQHLWTSSGLASPANFPAMWWAAGPTFLIRS